MTTTTFNDAGLRLRPGSSDRLATRGFATRFWDRLVERLRAEPATIIARSAGEAWCDATERRLIDCLTNRDTMRL